MPGTSGSSIARNSIQEYRTLDIVSDTFERIYLNAYVFQYRMLLLLLNFKLAFKISHSLMRSPAISYIVMLAFLLTKAIVLISTILSEVNHWSYNV